MPALAHRVTMPKPDDPDILERFSAGIAAGQPIEIAATGAGIAGRTAYDWIEQGNAALAEPSTEHSSVAQFAQMVKQAEHRFVSEHLGTITAASKGKGGWVPAMTLLERRRPQDFGRFQRIEVEQRSVTINLSAQLPEGAGAALLAMAQAEQQRAQLPSPSDTP